MLWWLPPTPVTQVLRVEKSTSRHAHHALESTQLRSTCILGKKHPPYAHTASFWAYAATVDLSLPPSLQRIQKSEKKKRGGNDENEVTYAD